jgi:hypothetical protein
MVQLLLRAVSRIRKKNKFAFGDDDTDDDEIKNLSKVVKHDLIFDVNLFKRPKEVHAYLYCKPVKVCSFLIISDLKERSSR